MVRRSKSRSKRIGGAIGRAKRARARRSQERARDRAEMERRHDAFYRRQAILLEKEHEDKVRASKEARRKSKRQYDRLRRERVSAETGRPMRKILPKQEATRHLVEGGKRRSRRSRRRSRRR